PRGVPQIEVTFDIDVNGILSVSAKDKSTGKQHKVTIQQSSGLSEAEIEKMRKDAESHAEEDRQRKELAEVKNRASNFVYQTEKMLKEHEANLDESAKSAIRSAIDRVNEAEKGDDAAAIKSALENLEQATHAPSKHIY